MRERQVRHVESSRAVLEHVDLVFRAEDPLLDRLRGFVLRDHPLDRLDFGRLRFAETVERGPEDLREGNALPRGPVARDRVAAARALREEPPLAAGGADAEAHLDVDGVLRGRVEQEPLRTPLMPDREEGMRGGLHLPRCRLFGPGHPRADPSRGPGPDGEACQPAHEGERIGLLRIRREMEGSVPLRDPEGREQYVGVAFEHQAARSHGVQGAQPDERLPKRLLGRDGEAASLEASVDGDSLPEATQLLYGQVVEE